MPVTLRNRSTKTAGQALAELAIFGSIMLIALAAIVRYGLNSIYTQEVMQDSYRASLREAYMNQPGGVGSVQIVKDRYIPDASRPFALGSRVPFVAGGTVSWTNRAIIDQIDRESELPTSVIHVNQGKPGGVNREYKTANYVAFYTVDPLIFKRVAQLYCNPQAGEARKAKNAKKELEACEDSMYRELRPISTDATLQWNGMTLTVLNLRLPNAITSGDTVIVVDSCAGEIADAGACKHQCDKMSGHYKSTVDGSWILKAPPIVPLPQYCSRVSVADSDPANPTHTKINAARAKANMGVDLSKSNKSIAFQGTVTAFSSANQAWEYDGTETIAGRSLRTQQPGGSFVLQEERLEHDFRKQKSGSWQTP